MEHVKELSVNIGSRPAGSEAEMRAALYIREELTRFGYETSLQAFEIQRPAGQSALWVLSPEARQISAQSFQTGAGGSPEGELAAAGLGRPEDFPADIFGKIALIERGELYFRDKVRNAWEAGAMGVIIYNNQPGTFQGQLGEQGGIPAVSISQEDGLALVELLRSGPVTVRLEVNTQTVAATSHNVLAEPPGGVCRVIAGGHYDSVAQGPGANDNASGTATVIEMARALAADGSFDDVCFALFGSEEIGLIGSAFYVQSLSEEKRSQIEAMLNFDMLGVGNNWPFAGSGEITQIAEQEAEALGLTSSAGGQLPSNAGSDHASFISAGIPAVIFNCFCDQHYHTADDRFEFVQPERLQQAGDIGLGIIQRVLAQ